MGVFEMKKADTFLRVDDVMKLLGIGKSKAYLLMHMVNDELKKQGYLTISGRVNREVFMRRLGIE